MGNFKVGDLCIGQNHVHNTEHNGCEYVITKALHETKHGLCYFGQWADEYHERYAYPYTLRLKRPPSTDDFTAGEWELCPWRPKRVEA